jgi:hypothetical protein
MNNDTSSSGLTRRSFIKRSVVAAVAVSSMTIFSGLVNADLPGATGTETIVDPRGWRCGLNMEWFMNVVEDTKASGKCRYECFDSGEGAKFRYWCKMDCTNLKTGDITYMLATCGEPTLHLNLDRTYDGAGNYPDCDASGGY